MSALLVGQTMQQILTVEINNNSSLGNSFRFGSANFSRPFENRSVVSEALLLSIATNIVHLSLQI